MKDPLEYSIEELNTLTDAELSELLDSSESLENLFNTEQTVLKLLINSLFGAMANKYFLLFNESMAAAITANGRYFIRKLGLYVEAELQRLLPSDKEYVISGDTDSLYYQIAGFVELYLAKNPDASISDCVDWVDEFEIKVIQPVITKCIKDFSKELNAYNPDAIGVEREIIADAGIIAAKKKYLARVRDSEGTRYPADEPYFKIMGMELAKLSTPAWSRKKLKEAIPHLLDKGENEIKQWLTEVKSEFLGADIIDIVHHGGVSNMDYVIGDKGIPIGSRAAIVHNNFIKKNNLEGQIEPIMGGTKCKRIFLLEPNPFNSNIIAFTNDNFIRYVIDYIDYDTNFEKGFLNPLKLMSESLNFNIDKQTAALDDW